MWLSFHLQKLEVLQKALLLWLVAIKMYILRLNSLQTCHHILHMQVAQAREAVPGVKGKEESEAGVGLDDPRLPIDSATLIQVQLTPGLQHRVQPIKHSGVTQVSTV